MTLTVSISDLRDNISDYLQKAGDGNTILIKDEKKNRVVAELNGRKQFDLKSYLAMLHRVSGTISAKDHPEWATKKKVVQWVNKSRREAERKFDVPS